MTMRRREGGLSLTPLGARFLLGSVTAFGAAVGTMITLGIWQALTLPTGFPELVVPVMGGSAVGAMIGAATIQYVRRRAENFTLTVGAAGLSGVLVPYPVFAFLPYVFGFVAVWAIVGGLTVIAEWRSAQRLGLDD